MPATTGVYFRRQDYANLPRRILIDLVDAVVVGSLCGLIFVLVRDLVSRDWLLAGWAAVFFCYFVLLKRSKIRTLGYRVGGVKIVGVDGRPPSLSALTFRLVFMAVGPLNVLFDIFFLSADPHRQAVRDKFAQTYVVKKSAEPAGSAPLLYRYYEIFGYNFLFREVAADAEPKSPSAAAAGDGR